MRTEENKEHESFGMLSISRNTGSERVLFGSSITHSNTIRLRVSTAHEKRHLNSFWYHVKENIVDIEMSPTQFTDAITNMNTEGTPVTIRYVEGKTIENPPYENVFEKFNNEFKADIDKVLSNTCKMMKKVEEKLKAPGTIKKSERIELADLLYKIEQDIRANLSFVNKQFNRQVTKSISEAKGSIEAFFVNTIHRFGSKKLKEELENGNIVPPQISINKSVKSKRIIKK